MPTIIGCPCIGGGSVCHAVTTCTSAPRLRASSSAHRTASTLGSEPSTPTTIFPLLAIRTRSFHVFYTVVHRPAAHQRRRARPDRDFRPVHRVHTVRPRPGGALCSARRHPWGGPWGGKIPGPRGARMGG